MNLASPIVAICFVLSQTGAQFAHFPATGGGTTNSRQPARPREVARPPARTPSRHEENEVDYEDRSEVRKPVSRNRGRTNSKSRSGAPVRISPNKSSNERSRPSLDYNTRVRARPSPQLTNNKAEDTFVVQQPARDQLQSSLAFEQFQPRIEQNRPEQTRQPPAQQFRQPQTQPTRQPQAQQFRQPQTEPTRQPPTQQFRQPQAQPQAQPPRQPPSQQFREQQAKQFMQPQAQQFIQQQPRQVAQLPVSRLVSQQTQQFPPQQQPRSLQPSPRGPAQRQQQPLPTQAAPVFKQLDSLFSNTIVNPHDGEQGDGVFFSYTAVLGN